MNMADERVRVKIDIKTGELEVDSPASQYAEVLGQVSSIIPALRSAHEAMKGTVSSSQQTDRVPPEQNDNSDKAKPKVRSAKAATGTSRGSMGAARYDDFSPIKLGISDEAELDLKKFYESRKPKGQEEQVAVIIYQLGKLLSKDRLNYDQIYQAFRVVGEANPPRSMAGVVSNMVTKMLADREGDGVRLKIQGLDLVEKQLPRTAK